MLSKVDFPLPDGPTIDTNWPFFIVKLIFRNATTFPAAPESYILERFSIFKAKEPSIADLVEVTNCVGDPPLKSS
ncbi:Uncharacterised protein [uncultured archaeon]|nr:Uncharacterised protein [uncultured archaeon]